MTDADNITQLDSLQLGRALVLEMGEEQARLYYAALLMVKNWTGVGEVRTNIRDGQITTIQPAPVLRKGSKLPPRMI